MKPTRKALSMYTNTEMNGRDPSLWDQILGLIERRLAQRCNRKLFVEVQDQSGLYLWKEIGELSASEHQSLHAPLRGQVVELLLDRHLAGQRCVDLFEKSGASTKKIEDLTPEDLPALIEADRQRAEEEHRRERERAQLVRETQSDSERILVIELLAKMTKAGDGVQ